MPNPHSGADYLLPDYEDTDNEVLEDENSEDNYEVEKIVAKRYNECGLEYCIKWDGYPDSDNSWKTRKHLAFLSDEQASLIPFCQVARKVVRKNISLSVNGSSEIVPIRNQNGRGRQTTAKQLSRFHGVTRYCGKLGVRWRASAVGSHIGSYADEEEAARATDEALRKFHGADAHGKKFRVWQCKLNFPTELETEAFQKQRKFNIDEQMHLTLFFVMLSNFEKTELCIEH